MEILQKDTVQNPLVFSEHGFSCVGQAAPNCEHGSKAEHAFETDAEHGARTLEFWEMDTLVNPMKVM